MSTSTLTRARARAQTRFPSSVLVAVGLAAGFGVAQGTGIRALGGVVFAAGGLGAAWLWHRRRGLAVTLGLGALYIGAFVMAHVFALGPAWLAVSLVTIAAAGVTFAAADRPQDDAAAG
jgi:CHASE2 domain-containing sensor protein